MHWSIHFRNSYKSYKCNKVGNRHKGMGRRIIKGSMSMMMRMTRWRVRNITRVIVEVAQERRLPWRQLIIGIIIVSVEIQWILKEEEKW